MPGLEAVEHAGTRSGGPGYGRHSVAVVALEESDDESEPHSAICPTAAMISTIRRTDLMTGLLVTVPAREHGPAVAAMPTAPQRTSSITVAKASADRSGTVM